ncbi:MAG TPA: class I SAM-dependent methyltransferase [Actinomycetota bacterium]|nr:class I SAM-dependent methyltransferase [Actinomycetota bacterium]
MAEWWEEMFSSEAWQAVQRNWSSVEDTADQTERVIEALGLDAGARVLDVPAGDGRIALELAAAGYVVVGVDAIAAFVEAGRRDAERRGLTNVTLEVGDMRELTYDAEFDAAICFWGSFGYFDDAGNLAQAASVARALRAGGRYLIDTPSLETLYPRFRERTWFRVDDTVVLQEASLVMGTGRVETEWTFVRSGVPAGSHRTSVRVYPVHELTELLREAGFESFELRDDELFDFELGSQRLWLIASKGEGG